MHTYIYMYIFSFLAVVTHDKWKLGTFPYPRSGIVPTLYIEGVKSFSISSSLCSGAQVATCVLLGSLSADGNGLCHKI